MQEIFHSKVKWHVNIKRRLDLSQLIYSRSLIINEKLLSILAQTLVVI